MDRIDTTTHYEVWRKQSDVQTKCKGLGEFSRTEVAQDYADQYNDEEATNARAELRKVRTEFFVVVATTERVPYVKEA